MTIITALGYGVPLVYLRLNEKQMVFEPALANGHTVNPLPDSLHLMSGRVQVTASDGARITGILIPAADTAAQW
ncbi:MAG TPA: hypothetical protein VKP68_01560, partial [Ramlibacter sp.]|nr:hypothetical protein [Ramlibacter sp.]